MEYYTIRYIATLKSLFICLSDSYIKKIHFMAAIPFKYYSDEFFSKNHSQFHSESKSFIQHFIYQILVVITTKFPCGHAMAEVVFQFDHVLEHFESLCVCICVALLATRWFNCRLNKSWTRNSFDKYGSCVSSLLFWLIMVISQWNAIFFVDLRRKNRKFSQKFPNRAQYQMRSALCITFHWFSISIHSSMNIVHFLCVTFRCWSVSSCELFFRDTWFQ